MNILITGGAGYIGSVMATYLLGQGHTITVLDNLTHGHRDAVPKGVKRFIKSDVADIDKVINKKDEIELVIHLAAYIAAGESMQYPEKYWDNNTRQTFALLNGMRALNIKKLIFASTAAVYGDPAELPITEQAVTKPINTYGMTKLAIDMAITSECIAHGLAATSLRFFNVAGAYEGVGERHPEETHIIPIALEVLLGKRNEFTLFGNDYATSDGTCIRDYVHVLDLARAAELAVQKLTPHTHAIFNLGSENGFSNQEVISAIEKVTGKQLPVRLKARREGDPAILVASSQTARSKLGWRPARPAIETMINDAWQFAQTRERNE